MRPTNGGEFKASRLIVVGAEWDRESERELVFIIPAFCRKKTNEQNYLSRASLKLYFLKIGIHNNDDVHSLAFDPDEIYLLDT